MPNINRSLPCFSPQADKTIVYSLSAKDTDMKSLNNIVEERSANGEFKDMTDYFKRCGKSVNKKSFRALISIGAFDSLLDSRKRYIDAADAIYKKLDNIKAAAVRAEAKGKAPKMNFDNSFILDVLAPAIPEYTISEKLKLEREFSGSYLTGHPLDKYAFTINKLNAQELSYLDYELDEETGTVTPLHGIKNNENVTIIAVVTELTKTKTRKDGKPMAIMTIEDLTGAGKAFAFPKAYEKLSDVIEENQVYQIQGEIRIKVHRPQFTPEILLLTRYLVIPMAFFSILDNKRRI